MENYYQTDREIEILSRELSVSYPYSACTIYNLLTNYRDFINKGITKSQAEKQISAKAYFGY